MVHLGRSDLIQKFQACRAKPEPFKPVQKAFRYYAFPIGSQVPRTNPFSGRSELLMFWVSVSLSVWPSHSPFFGSLVFFSFFFSFLFFFGFFFLSFPLLWPTRERKEPKQAKKKKKKKKTLNRAILHYSPTGFLSMIVPHSHLLLHRHHFELLRRD